MILKRIIERLGGYTIKTRLVMAFIALISIPMLISTLIVSNLITKKLTGLSHQRLKLAAVNIKGNLEKDTKKLLLEQASYYARSGEIVLGVGLNASRQEFQNILIPVRKILNIDVVEVLDQNGVVLAREWKGAGQKEGAISSPDLISTALSGRDFVSLIEGQKGINLIVGSPISSNNKTIGIFVLGRYIDTEFLESLKSITGMDSLLGNSKGEIVLSTAKINTGEKIKDITLANKSKDGINIYTGTINKEEWHLASIELKDWKENTIATLYIIDSLSSLKEDVNKIRYTLILMTSIFLAVVILLGVITARRIVNPMERVIGLLKNIAEGEADLTKRLDISSKDEVGQLAGWFNTFVDTLQGIIKKVTATSENVVGAMKNISDFSKSVSTGAQKQSISIENTAASLNQMDSSLNKVSEHMTELSTISDDVAASVTEIVSSIQEVSKQAEKSAISVDETSSSIIEMGQSITEVSKEVESLTSMAEETAASISEISTSIKEVEKGAKLSADRSEQTLKLAQDGKEAVSKTLDGMHAIKESVEGSANIVKKLGDKSKEIDKILNVINEIAEQTTLLALNAAIIAAQAGEHGRGFAVVADEIKNLAERTAVSIKEIDPIIKSIQTETQDAAKAMDSGLKSMRDGVTLSTLAGDALNKIAASAEDTRNMVFQIAKATLEQSKGSEQIKISMSNVTRSVNTILKATQEQATGGRRISLAAEEIREVTGQVKRATLEQSKGSNQISKAMGDIANRVQSALTSINEQKGESKLILKAISEIENTTTENVDRVSSMDFEVVKLTELVKQLQDQVGRFKV
ncbi:MAG: methyl-accepting chemotaxis protein [Nitrospirota bacterium]